MGIYTKKVTIPELGVEIEFKTDVTVTRPGSSFIYHEPKYFYHKVVKENLKEFYRDEANERKAINACITLYHVADWYCPTKEGRKKIYEDMPYSGALESIANGTKHFNLEKPYHTGRKEGSHVSTKLIVNDGKETIELQTILRKIEKFWNSKLGDKYTGPFNQ